MNNNVKWRETIRRKNFLILELYSGFEILKSVFGGRQRVEQKEEGEKLLT